MRCDALPAQALGVSNFNTRQINQLCDAAKVQPVCNQVESHPFFAQASRAATTLATLARRASPGIHEQGS